jgi:hypothetical protein
MALNGLLDIDGGIHQSYHGPPEDTAGSSEEELARRLLEFSPLITFRTENKHKPAFVRVFMQ